MMDAMRGLLVSLTWRPERLAGVRDHLGWAERHPHGTGLQGMCLPLQFPSDLVETMLVLRDRRVTLYGAQLGASSRPVVSADVCQPKANSVGSA